MSMVNEVPELFDLLMQAAELPIDISILYGIFII